MSPDENTNSLYATSGNNANTPGYQPIYPTALTKDSNPGNLGNPDNNTYTCNSQQFRLVEIQKMRNDIESRIKHKEQKIKKYKAQMRAFDATNGVLSFISVGSGSAAAGTAIAVITIPVAIPLGTISAVTGVASAAVLLISRNRRQKISLLMKALIDEKSVYNAIISYISKAINDAFITDDEFQYIRKMYEGSDMKPKVLSDDMNQLAMEIATLLKNHKK